MVKQTPPTEVRGGASQSQQRPFWAAASASKEVRPTTEVFFTPEIARERVFSSILGGLVHRNIPDIETKLHRFVDALKIPTDPIVLSVHVWPYPERVFILSKDLLSRIKNSWSGVVKQAAEDLLYGRPVPAVHLTQLSLELESFATSTHSVRNEDFFLAVLNTKSGRSRSSQFYILENGAIVVTELTKLFQKS